MITMLPDNYLRVGSIRVKAKDIPNPEDYDKYVVEMAKNNKT